MVAMIRAASLANFVDVARQVGIDPFRALRRTGIDQHALTDPELRIPAAPALTLLEAAAEESGCETFGLRMGELRRLSDFGALSLLITHQPTLGAALETLLNYRRMLNPSLMIDVEVAGELVIVRETLLVGEAPPSVQAHELMIAVLFRMFRGLLGPRWRPLSVNFMHPAPRELQVHRRVFGAALEFASEFNGIVLAAADLDRPNPTADPALAHYAQQFVETLPNSGGDSARHQTRKAIYQLLPLGRAAIGPVAASLGLQERTLQRRLADEDAQFSDLVRGVRRDLAPRYLGNPKLSVTEVAGLLGYSQLSSFTRWFIAEFGAPPARWRSAATLAGD